MGGQEKHITVVYVTDRLRSLQFCNIVPPNQPFVQHDEVKINISSVCFCKRRWPVSLFVIIFSLVSPCPPYFSTTGFWLPRGVTWLCSGTCVVCVAAAGTRWAPAGSLWTASVASPPAHAPPLEHTNVSPLESTAQQHNYGMFYW